MASSITVSLSSRIIHHTAPLRFSFCLNTSPHPERRSARHTLDSLQWLPANPACCCRCLSAPELPEISTTRPRFSRSPPLIPYPPVRETSRGTPLTCTNLSEHDNSCAVNSYGAGERRRGVTRKRGGALGHRHARNPRNPKPFHHTQASPSPQSLTITTAVPSRHSPQQSDTLHIHPTITHTVRTTVYTHRAPHTAVTVALHCTVGTVCTGRNTGPLDPAVDFSNSSDTVP